MELPKNYWIVVTVAIICLSVMEVVALMNGVNGNLFCTVAFIIGGLAGWTVPTWLRKRKA